MRTVELFRLSSSALTRHKMRAFLTLLGVIIGVATVVGVVSVISGLNTYVKDKLFGLNPDIVIFTKYGIITSREEWLIARKRRDVTLTDMQIVRQECRLCAEVGAEGDRNRPVKFMDRKLSDVQVQGHTANMTSLLLAQVIRHGLIHGRRCGRRVGRELICRSLLHPGAGRHQFAGAGDHRENEDEEQPP